MGASSDCQTLSYPHIAEEMVVNTPESCSELTVYQFAGWDHHPVQSEPQAVGL